MIYGKYINTLYFFGISVCALLSACSNSVEPQSNENRSGEFSFDIPPAIAKAEFNPADLELTVLVNEQNVAMMPLQSDNPAGGTTWSATIPVPVGVALQISVRWSIGPVDLATLDRTLTALTADGRVTISPSNYIYPDEDKDNFTNLQELKATPPTEVDNAFSIPTADAVLNPNGIDANRDGIADAQDDINGDGLVDSNDLPRTYNIGDKGPAGGWVIHLTDKGRGGLEVAPEDYSRSVRWYCDDVTLPGAEGILVGTGKQNTINMLDGCASTGFVDAASAADTYEFAGFTDWFLPSIAELNLIAALVERGKLNILNENIHYWSSSQHETATSAWAYDISSVNQVLHERSDLLRVRAIRAF